MFTFIRKSVFILSLTILIFCVSCSDDDDNPTNNGYPNSGNTLSASISGYITKNFNANLVIYMYQNIGETSQTVIMAYVGTQTQFTEVITIQAIDLPVGPQTLDVSDFGNSFIYARMINGSLQQFVATEGTINIQVNNETEISGTFNVTVGSEYSGDLSEIKNGTFYCKKQ